MNYTSVPLLSLKIRILDVVSCGLRDVETAKSYQNRIFTIPFSFERENTLSKNAIVFRAFSNLGESKEAQEESIDQIKNAIETYNKMYHGGGKHRMQAFAYFVLGQLYEQLNDPEKAMEAYQMSESIYDTVLKKK